MLVAYSDSEGSDNETVKTKSTVATDDTKRNFAVDKSNPKKIRVSLQPQQLETNEDEQPPAKRPRVGAGTFSGFNAMLPAPKRVNEPASNSKSTSRKVFSLKTGAEPAFSRESDAELKQFFSEQPMEFESAANSSTTETPKPDFISDLEPPIQTQGKPLMFKPLSVARNNKKKSKKTVDQIAMAGTAQSHVTAASSASHLVLQDHTAKKISLFSSGAMSLPEDVEDADDIVEENEIAQVLDDGSAQSYSNVSNSTSAQPTDSLNSIADGLNLSAAERRQLFGRGSQGTNGKIITFNTDAEYAANQAHIAAGDQVQHNPVRAIAPGKHSLKSLVASAAGQKDALEESFATGRKNKKEAGSKYGW